MLKSLFTELVSKYDGKSLAGEYWQELEAFYSQPQRFYHNLSHLEQLYQELEAVTTSVSDWDAICFAIYYHDAVYDAASLHNEEKSAELAERRLGSMHVPEATTSKSCRIILATKRHERSDDDDVNFFTDADLSVLGREDAAYAAYYNQIRKEYAIYPDALYYPGRKKVLEHFLQMDVIFKTSHFYHRYEAQARKNLKVELEMITNSLHHL
jgi:predicted metal-dependent HD superfamily phosphohydrolase